MMERLREEQEDKMRKREEEGKEEREERLINHVKEVVRIGSGC